jgi:hypothetical protein
MALVHLLVGCSLLACGEPEPHRRRELPPEVEPAPRPRPEQVYAPPGDDGGLDDGAYRVVTAFVPDGDYAGDEVVEARRLVYRVRLRVPRSLGDAPETVPHGATELAIDVSADRLRARFEGTGWPVPAGSEVRLRADQPGVYVFDDRGGRPLGPGQLAAWFEGGRLRRDPSVRVRPAPVRQQRGPGLLVCRFLAEWSSSAPDALARRCGEAGTLVDFRVGLWRADRTADVAMDLPRSGLRADQEDPPRRLPVTNHHFVTSSVLSRMRPARRLPAAQRELAPEHGELVVRNRGRARMIITVAGLPVGWVDEGHTLTLSNLRSGFHEVGAMRPLGLQTARLRPVEVPGEVRLPR